MALEKNCDIEVQRMNVKKAEYDLFSARGVARETACVAETGCRKG